MQDKSLKHNTLAGPMFSKEDTDFIDFLFGKLTCLKTMDVDMIDLHDDDAAMADAIEWTKLELS